MELDAVYSAGNTLDAEMDASEEHDAEMDLTMILDAELSHAEDFDAELENVDERDAELEKVELVRVYVGEVAGVYEGDYTVTPKVTNQVLPTENKVLLKDVTVLEIPYYEVSNPQNGKTIIIGG